MAEDPTNYDCQTCGACCVPDYASDAYVHVRPEELVEWSDDDVQEYVVYEQIGGLSQPALKTLTDRDGSCRCKALRGSPGQSVECVIYAQRPALCRRFKAGSGECDAARQASFGISLR